MRIVSVLLACLCTIGGPAFAQRTADLQTGQTADTGAGEVGQRQSREEAAPNIEPLRRIDTRVQNRVQNRIRNRIDRYYDPRANATSPFEIAREATSEAARRTAPR